MQLFTATHSHLCIYTHPLTKLHTQLCTPTFIIKHSVIHTHLCTCVHLPSQIYIDVYNQCTATQPLYTVIHTVAQSYHPPIHLYIPIYIDMHIHLYLSIALYAHLYSYTQLYSYSTHLCSYAYLRR